MKIRSLFASNEQLGERVEWETIEHDGANGSTERLKIEDGWLYRTTQRMLSGPSPVYACAMAFVPDAPSK